MKYVVIYYHTVVATFATKTDDYSMFMDTNGVYLKAMRHHAVDETHTC